MKSLHLHKFIPLLILSALLLGSCQSAFFSRSQTRKVERSMAGSSRKSVKMKEAPAVRRAKKSQEKNQEKLHREYHKSVGESRKRTYEIQSDDVKARMKQNDADRKIREKNKSKKTHQATRKAGRKYN